MSIARYHHGDLKNALVLAGLRWLDERGELPSMRQLASACEVSHAAPYRHFSDADELKGSMAARCFDEMHDAIDADMKLDPDRTLEAGTRAYVRWGLQHSARYSLMFGLKSPIPQHPECARAAERAFRLLVGAAQQQGRADPVRDARALWAAMHGVVELLRHQLLPPSGPGAEEQLIDDLVAMSVAFLEG
jgi:AcrR family transcriptional regulator